MHADTATRVAELLRSMAAHIEDGTLALGPFQAIWRGDLGATVELASAERLVISVHLQSERGRELHPEVEQELSHPGG